VDGHQSPAKRPACCRVLVGLGTAADEYARSLLPVLRALRNEGTISIGATTRALNDRKIRMSRGSQWHVSSVANLLARTQKLEAAR
jgi:hypothetical protein